MGLEASKTKGPEGCRRFYVHLMLILGVIVLYDNVGFRTTVAEHGCMCRDTRFPLTPQGRIPRPSGALGPSWGPIWRTRFPTEKQGPLE